MCAHWRREELEVKPYGDHDFVYEAFVQRLAPIFAQTTPAPTPPAPAPQARDYRIPPRTWGSIAAELCVPLSSHLDLSQVAVGRLKAKLNTRVLCEKWPQGS